MDLGSMFFVHHPKIRCLVNLLTSCYVCGSQPSKTCSRKRIMINVMSGAT